MRKPLCTTAFISSVRPPSSAKVTSTWPSRTSGRTRSVSPGVCAWARVAGGDNQDEAPGQNGSRVQTSFNHPQKVQPADFSTRSGVKWPIYDEGEPLTTHEIRLFCLATWPSASSLVAGPEGVCPRAISLSDLRAVPRAAGPEIGMPGLSAVIVQDDNDRLVKELRVSPTSSARSTREFDTPYAGRRHHPGVHRRADGRLHRSFPVRDRSATFASFVPGVPGRREQRAPGARRTRRTAASATTRRSIPR